MAVGPEAGRPATAPDWLMTSLFCRSLQEPADIYHAGDDALEAPTKVGACLRCRTCRAGACACASRRGGGRRREGSQPAALSHMHQRSSLAGAWSLACCDRCTATPFPLRPPCFRQLESMGHETLQHHKERIMMAGATGALC